MASNPLMVALGSSLAPQPEEKPSRFPGMSKGQIIAGILADALAGAAGHAGPFAAMMQQRQQQEQEETNWRRRLEESERIKHQYPDVSPMERDVQAWSRMTPEQKAAYQQMQGLKQGDPDVFVTLPNGQVYAGPKSGLAQALMGGAPQVKTAPRGNLTPITGGPTPQASGGFRFP